MDFLWGVLIGLAVPVGWVLWVVISSTGEKRV